MQCEIKKIEKEKEKLQEQIKRVMGIDKAFYLNGIDVTCNVFNGANI